MFFYSVTNNYYYVAHERRFTVAFHDNNVSSRVDCCSGSPLRGRDFRRGRDEIYLCAIRTNDVRHDDRVDGSFQLSIVMTIILDS